MEEGTVKWFDEEKGYGFIEQDIGEDLFVHYSDIEQDGFKSLSEDQRVEFIIEETEEGLAARDVGILSTTDEELDMDSKSLEERMNSPEQKSSVGS